VTDTVEKLAPGVSPISPGEVLAAKYRVDRVLGVGGMGVVVAATHLQLDQKVALKFMLPQALQHPTLVERFAREARAAVRLRSDHVARVLDVGTLETGSPYMVMEYLEGSDLADIVEQKGRMPVEVAVDSVLQACDAVAEAHSIGIVHRDLKPRNLFMTRRNDGRALVKVLDFGISKYTTGGDLSLTRTTEIIGSPNYMSPEQLRSARNTDLRSDIWALGVILYELLAGQVPFVAESVTQLTAMVLTEPPRSLESLRADVPRPLVRIIERCLEKDPARRFASIAELAAALQPYAPPDTRDLAARIARIASGGRSSSTPVAGSVPGSPSASADAVPARSGTGTGGNWAGSGKPEPMRAGPGKAVAIVVALFALVAAIGGLVLSLRSKTPAMPPAAATDPAMPTAPMARPTPSVVELTPDTPTVLPSPPAIPAGVAAAVPTTAAASATATATSPKHAQGKPAASAPPPATPAPTSTSTEDSPRYRTNW
jgi:serine/threonine protein kinase